MDYLQNETIVVENLADFTESVFVVTNVNSRELSAAAVQSTAVVVDRIFDVIENMESIISNEVVDEVSMMCV